MGNNPYTKLAGTAPSKGVLTCLNGYITPRTGTDKISGVFSIPPLADTNFIFIYNPDEMAKTDDPSPGVVVACTVVEKIGNLYKMQDTDGRSFELEVLNGKAKT